MSMLESPHEDVFEDVRDRMSRVFGINRNFRDRLEKAEKIKLEITKDKILVEITVNGRVEGFVDSI